jgi:amino acid transporter
MRFVLPQQNQKILGVSPRFLTRVFVGCDILSLLVQCGGTGVASSQNWEGNTGVDVLIAGLATQLATNMVFMALVAIFYRRTVVNGQVSADAPREWRRILWTVICSILLVFVSLFSACGSSTDKPLIRSVYRLIEFCLGFNGYPFTHEWIFYVLESIPMLVAISLFCFYFPGKDLPKKITARPNNEIEAGKY